MKTIDEMWDIISKAANDRDHLKIEQTLRELQGEVQSVENRDAFVKRIENTMTGTQAYSRDSVVAFLNVLKGEDYSIYDQNGDEVLYCGEWY